MKQVKSQQEKDAETQKKKAADQKQQERVQMLQETYNDVTKEEENEEDNEEQYDDEYGDDEEEMEDEEWGEDELSEYSQDDPYLEVKEDIDELEKELAALKEKEYKYKDEFLMQQEKPEVQIAAINKMIQEEKDAMNSDKYRNDHAKKNLNILQTQIAECEIFSKLSGMQSLQNTSLDNMVKFVERANENLLKFNQANAENNADFLHCEQEETELIEK